MAPGQSSGLRRALGALEFRDYRWFAAAQLVSSLGAQVLAIATLWQVNLLTGNPLALGLTGLARAVPHIALSLVGGVIADRFDRVRMIQISQAANGALSLVLGALTLTGQIALWHVYAFTFLNSAFSALTGPGRTALVPNLVPRHHLVNAIALNTTIGQSSNIVGPAIGGLMIGAFDLSATYLFNAVAYLGSMWALALIRAVAAPPPVEESPWRSLKDGLGFVRENSVIVSLMGMDFAAMLFGSYRALLPVFAVSLGVGPEGFGLLNAAPGVGSLLGAAIIMSLGDMRYKGLYTVFGILGYCAALVLLGLSPSIGPVPVEMGAFLGGHRFLLALLASGLLGLTDSIQMIPRNTAILSITPDLLRGRVEAFRSMLAGGGMPLGFVIGGALAHALGAPIAVIGGAATCAVVVIGVAVTRREVRDPELGTLAAAEAATRN